MSTLAHHSINASSPREAIAHYIRTCVPSNGSVPDNTAAYFNSHHHLYPIRLQLEFGDTSVLTKTTHNFAQCVSEQTGVVAPRCALLLGAEITSYSSPGGFLQISTPQWNPDPVSGEHVQFTNRPHPMNNVFPMTTHIMSDGRQRPAYTGVYLPHGTGAGTHPRFYPSHPSVYSITAPCYMDAMACGLQRLNAGHAQTYDMTDTRKRTTCAELRDYRVRGVPENGKLQVMDDPLRPFIMNTITNTPALSSVMRVTSAGGSFEAGTWNSVRNHMDAMYADILNAVIPLDGTATHGLRAEFKRHTESYVGTGDYASVACTLYVAILSDRRPSPDGGAANGGS